MVSEWLQIEAFVLPFEKAWANGNPPAIREFLPPDLPKDDRLRLAGLKALVEVDHERRRALGQAVRFFDYLGEYPELVDAFAQAFEQQSTNGSLDDIDEFVAQINPDEDGEFRRMVLKALIDMQRNRRRQAGELVRDQEYLDRFPELAAVLPQPTTVGSPRPKERMASPKDAPEHIGGYAVKKVLGEGAFGVVYLAYDRQLERHYAIKVPRPGRVSRPKDAQAYLKEARIVARLNHPNIVPVYHVGSTDEHPFFIVSKFIEGGTLAERIRNQRFTMRQSAELAAIVAETLHYAHRQGLVHRDIKPGNILLERAESEIDLPVPFVADFGLALENDEVGSGPSFAGTPAFMSPEQARGEGHRVDGRSDIFSLGVVLYELLTGKRPFPARNHEELLFQITNMEVRPPRQLAEIDKELERICLKSLAKRAADRYMAAQDMADDLRHFLRACAASVQPTASPPPTSTEPTPLDGSSRLAVKIVPKGLESFDAHDADFFLELVPGPRDRTGLPDGLRFWKDRIEERDADNTFAVGLIYGPSGCGKSSLVKAGLLPRLREDVRVVYVEATAEETETRLLNGLRKRCPALSDKLGLKESLAALRLGQGIPVGTKVFIVLDQFEQWLHAKKEERNAELVQALRQCDGGRLQCVVMVRDDFWMAVTRFMRELEIHLVEGQNSAAVDLFDLDHARKVLAAFGRAFGKLPDNGGETSKDQKQFLTQAVSLLGREGKVISVRLSLFAEMMKGKPWSPATLHEVGGMDGIGVRFLDETFSASTAPPEHRYHQNAASAVLKALLPEARAEIKGHMRSHAALLTASGYADKPKDFSALLQLLNAELRLITPTDPEGQDDGPAAAPTTGEKYYQLTHDYLVPSLRTWLTRKQKETWTGRAELLLAERAADYQARPVGRQLPSLWQWLRIRLHTRKRNWVPPERKMMRAASRYHGRRAAVAGVVLVVLSFIGWEGLCRLRAANLMANLLRVNIASVPGIVADMSPFRRLLEEPLRESFAKESDPDKKLALSLALLPWDANQVEFLYARMLDAAPSEFCVIRRQLRDSKSTLIDNLWADLKASNRDPHRQLRIYAALADYDPTNAQWETARVDAVEILATQTRFVIADWTRALQGIGHWLVPFLDEPTVHSKDKTLTARLQADVGVALIVMEMEDTVWNLLRHGSDPTLRSLLIERMGPGGVEPKTLLSRLDATQDNDARHAVLLSLGETDLNRLSESDRQKLQKKAVDLFLTHPDAGIHGAAEWFLRTKLQVGDRLNDRVQALTTRDPVSGRRWYVNGQGHTMIVLARGGFLMGEVKKRTTVDHEYVLSAKEVTVKQFMRFWDDKTFWQDHAKKQSDKHKVFPDIAPSDDCPIHMVSWYEAAAYCNWLSKTEGIPKEEWCYVPNDAREFAKGMKVSAHGTGYRLPSEIEWEYACRAGTDTTYFFGDSQALLDKYAWHAANANLRSHPVAALKPSIWGFYDMLGNAAEWTLPYVSSDLKAVQILNGVVDVSDTVASRGGAFPNQAGSQVYCAAQTPYDPNRRGSHIGFRVARTYPDQK